MAYLNLCLQLFAGTAMFIVLEGDIRGGYTRSRSTTLFFLMLFSDILMLVSGGLDNLVIYKASVFESHKWTEPLLSGISDMSYFLVLAFFILYLDSYERENRKISAIAWTGSIVSAAYGIFWLITDFVGGIYTQGEEAIVYDSLYIVGQIGGYVTGFLSVIILMKRWKEFNRRERTGFALFIFVPLIGSLFKGVLTDIIIMPVFVTISVVFIHSFIQMNREILLKKQQADLARLQADIVMNRLKPHFI